MAQATLHKLSDILGSELVMKRDGKVIPGNLSQLDGKYVALYFSAHW